MQILRGVHCQSRRFSQLVLTSGGFRVGLSAQDFESSMPSTGPTHFPPPSPSSRRLFSLLFHLLSSLSLSPFCLCPPLCLSPCDVALVLCLVCVRVCVCVCWERRGEDRVYVQNVLRVSICVSRHGGRFESTHSSVHLTTTQPHTTTTTQHNTTQHNTQHHTETGRDRDRERRQRKREREKRQDKTRQRLFFKERSGPYQPNKERGKTVEDESDRSLSS